MSDSRRSCILKPGFRNACSCSKESIGRTDHQEKRYGSNLERAHTRDVHRNRNLLDLVVVCSSDCIPGPPLQAFCKLHLAFDGAPTTFDGLSASLQSRCP